MRIISTTIMVGLALSCRSQSTLTSTRLQSSESAAQSGESPSSPSNQPSTFDQDYIEDFSRQYDCCLPEQITSGQSGLGSVQLIRILAAAQKTAVKKKMHGLNRKKALRVYPVRSSTSSLTTDSSYDSDANPEGSKPSYHLVLADGHHRLILHEIMLKNRLNSQYQVEDAGFLNFHPHIRNTLLQLDQQQAIHYLAQINAVLPPKSYRTKLVAHAWKLALASLAKTDIKSDQSTSTGNMFGDQSKEAWQKSLLDDLKTFSEDWQSVTIAGLVDEYKERASFEREVGANLDFLIKTDKSDFAKGQPNNIFFLEFYLGDLIEYLFASDKITFQTLYKCPFYDSNEPFDKGDTAYKAYDGWYREIIANIPDPYATDFSDQQTNQQTKDIIAADDLLRRCNAQIYWQLRSQFGDSIFVTWKKHLQSTLIELAKLAKEEQKTRNHRKDQKTPDL